MYISSVFRMNNFMCDSSVEAEVEQQATEHCYGARVIKYKK